MSFMPKGIERISRDAVGSSILRTVVALMLACQILVAQALPLANFRKTNDVSESIVRLYGHSPTCWIAFAVGGLLLVSLLWRPLQFASGITHAIYTGFVVAALAHTDAGLAVVYSAYAIGGLALGITARRS